MARDTTPSAPPWPQSAAELEGVQLDLAAAADRVTQATWRAPVARRRVAGCFVCFGRDGAGLGAAGDPGWAGAVCLSGGREVARAAVTGLAAAAYEPGRLALREGQLLEAAVRALDEPPDLLLVDATGRDHPRRAGLALHLGARLDTPSIGITNRLLVATGAWPDDVAGARSPIVLHGELVGFWLRVRRGVRPIAVHAGWGVHSEAAVEVVRPCILRARTPEPLRAARRLARETRDRALHANSEDEPH